MRTALSAILSILLLAASPAAALAGEPTPAPRTLADEAGTRFNGQDFAAAWNAHDTSAMAALFTEDADIINPFGRIARGRKDIERLFRDEHRGVMKGSHFALKKHDVRFLAPDLAVADLDVVINLVDKDGVPLSPLPCHITNVLVRTSVGWRIAVSRPAVYAPEPQRQPR